LRQVMHGNTHISAHESAGLERLWSPADVAVALDVSVKTVHKLVRDGKLACVQVTARDRRFTQQQVQEFIQFRTTPIRVDKKPGGLVSSPHRKGGVKRKSAGDVGTDLVKEIRSLCR